MRRSDAAASQIVSNRGRLLRDREAPMLRRARRMVSSGAVVIVEPDPTVGSIWAEVAAFAGFSADVVSGVPEARSSAHVHALIVRVSFECHRVPSGWKAEQGPRLIALVPAECTTELDLADFDVVLPCDGQVHALYDELHRLAGAL